jgi:asparagine synthetase B (glutamine-hydrolysing)
MSTPAVEMPTATPQAGRADEWLLTLDVDAPVSATLQGGGFVTRGPISAFVDGILFEIDDWRRAHSLPATAGPADVVAAAYERGGIDTLPKLRGSFVAVVVDRARNTTTVVRDPLGSHPLFYARTGAVVRFATSIARLLRESPVPRTLNRVAIADHLCSRWPDIHETFFSGIRRVPPGWRIAVKDGAITRERYWNPVPDYDRPIEWMTEEETGRFSEVLDRAVSRCVSAGTPGIFLSGGFDSGSIAAFAADQLRSAGRPAPLALSLAFPDPSCDETAIQHGVASKLGLPQRMVPFREAVAEGGLLASGLRLNRHLAGPLFNNWAPAYLELARRGRDEGVTTILTGSGGDEWLGVSPFLAADLIRQLDVPGLVQFAKVWKRSYSQAWMPALTGTFWTFGARPLLGQLLSQVAPQAWDRSRMRRAHNSDPSWVAPDPELRAEMKRRSPMALAPANPGGGFYARESRNTLDHMLMSRDLEEQYELGRRMGIRFLHPYWDVDLAAHIYRTPPSLLLKGGRAKGAVREMMAQRFPGLGFEKQAKSSALDFFRSTAASEGPRVRSRVGRFSALGGLGVVDPGGVEVFLDRAFEKRDRQMFRSCHLFNVEVWVRHALGEKSSIDESED